MTQVLLIKSGEAAAAVRLATGDYDRWFLQTASAPGVKFDILKACLGEKLPKKPDAYDAIIMTGSPLSVTEPAPWMLEAAEFLRMAGAKNIPVLGVCFGHQLLSLAYGGRVIKNPRGREIGTIEVELSPEGSRDFLFEGLPHKFTAQATHEDEVPALPKGATLLARNALSPIQAMAIGPSTRGVQFHPEMGTDGMRSVILARSEKLELEGQAKGMAPGERVQRLLSGVGPTPFAARILRNFIAHAQRARA